MLLFIIDIEIFQRANAPFQRRLDGYPAKRQLHPQHCFTGETSADFTPGSPTKPAPIEHKLNKNLAWAVRCKRFVGLACAERRASVAPPTPSDGGVVPPVHRHQLQHLIPIWPANHRPNLTRHDALPFHFFTFAPARGARSACRADLQRLCFARLTVLRLRAEKKQLSF